MSLILIAMPEEWGKLTCSYLHAHGFSTIAAYTKEEFTKLLRQQTGLSGIVAVSDWVMSEQNGNEDGIIKQLQGKIPTVTIITDESRQKSGYRYMDEVFFLPKHEYVTAPFSLEELAVRMEKVGMMKPGSTTR